MENIDPDLIATCARIAARAGVPGTPVATGVRGLGVMSATRSSELCATVYRPMICLVLQGSKEIEYHGRGILFGAGQTSIVSHELVAGARIVDAPYLALACELDVDILRTLQAEIEPDAIEAARADAVAAGSADRAVVDAMARLLDLGERPLEQKVLDPLIRRELHFRVLLTRDGAMLRQLARPGSPASRIARAIVHLKNNWNATVRTEELADIAGMSASSFHEHFRRITSTTPIQYQKSLRLVEARRRLTEAGQPVSTVAFAVGYESPTQFSRDYRRVYGAAPRDARRASA